MQERIFLETDVHERGLEAVFEVAHLALENAADEAFLGGAFDVEFLQLAVLDHRHARFERLGIDDNLLVDFFLRADEALDPFDKVGGRDLDGVQNAFRLLLDCDRLKRFFLLHLGGRVEMRLAEFLFGRAGLRRLLFRHSLRRQAGRDIFGAFDFVGVPFFKKPVGAALFAHGVGARLAGFTVGFLRGLAKAALGAEMHSAAPP